MKRMHAIALVAVLTLTATSAIAAERSCMARGDAYVLRIGDTTMMNGDGMDSGELKALQRKYGTRFLWMRRAGKTYLVHDKSILDRAWETGRVQSEIGEQQGALGAKQAALGARQAAIGAQQAALALSQDSARQDELSRQQTVLGREQSRLGEQQSVLGRAQERASAEAQRQLCALADEAIRTGKAIAVAK